MLAATALALRRAGARTLTVVLMTLSAAFASHGGPTAVIAMLAFFCAAYTCHHRTITAGEPRAATPT